MSASTSDTSHESSHLSIGEVLNILREDFSDITISKIRFLESQGLIDPERTPSGYRKFYESDVSRLRWILHQQKENFLPLKVIKERLEELSDGEQPAEVSPIGQQPAVGVGLRRRSRRPPDPSVAPPLPFDAPPRPERPSRPAASAAAPPVAAEPPPAAAPTPTPPPEPSPDKAGLTRSELARVVGLEDGQLAELESFGLITPAAEADHEVLFDKQGQAIAEAATGFYKHGLTARHLRMYKHFAEREAALFEQVSMRYLRQRNPDARAKAQEELAELSKLGRALRAALLVQAIRESLAG
jgi:DNA-binding transcriptional MerR regulator